MACPVGLGVGGLFAHTVARSSTVHRPPRLGRGVHQHRHGVGACRYCQRWHRPPRQPRRGGHTSGLHLVLGRRGAACFTRTAPRPVYRYRVGQHSSRLSFQRMGRFCTAQPGPTTRPTHHALSSVVAEHSCQRIQHPTPFLYLSVDCPTALWLARERTKPVMVHWAFAKKAHLL
jgi:hypothetical protein